MGAIRHKILIVDDEERVLSAIERLVRKDNYEVLLATSGRAALEILSHTEVAVIICDQRMPGMAGDEILAKAAAIRPDSFRITLTGDADLKDAQALINRAGINRYLVKPWDDVDLRSVIREGIEWHELRRENKRLQEVTQEQNAKLSQWNKELENQVQQRTQELQQQNHMLQQLDEQLQRSLHDTVSVIAGLLEAISPPLGIHSRRVARLAGEVGRRLQVSVEELREIEFAALLHDIGKISHQYQGATGGRPRESRIGSAMIRHPECGAVILSHVDGFDRIALAVKHQQEHYDGKNSPNGLRGSQIPLASRIIAAANAYDKAAFQGQDPSRPANEAARDTLNRQNGAKFDPSIVSTLLDCVGAAFTNSSGMIESQLSPRQLRPGMVLARAVYSHKGILLLKEGTVLTESFISHIRDLSDVDPLLTDVYIRSQAPSVPAARVVQPQSIAPPAPAQPTRPAARPAASVERIDVPGSRPSPAPVKAPATPPSSAAGGAQTGVAPAAPSSGGAGPPSGTSQASHTSQQSARPRKLVLVVDDSSSVCSALQRELRRAGYDSISANNGAQALRLLEDYKPDLAITDLAMPGMSGEQLMGYLQQCAPDMPCIIITGNATTELVRKLVKAPNVAGFLVKPWEYQRLMQVVSTALAKVNLGATLERIKQKRMAEPVK